MKHRNPVVRADCHAHGAKIVLKSKRTLHVRYGDQAGWIATVEHGEVVHRPKPVALANPLFLASAMLHELVMRERTPRPVHVTD